MSVKGCALLLWHQGLAKAPAGLPEAIKGGPAGGTP
jgi:hypothetical protein